MKTVGVVSIYCCRDNEYGFYEILPEYENDKQFLLELKKNEDIDGYDGFSFDWSKLKEVYNPYVGQRMYLAEQEIKYNKCDYKLFIHMC